MDTNDEYLVFFSPLSRAYFYCKNKTLHREAGPAILMLEDKEKYFNLPDGKIYQKVNYPVIEEKPFIHWLMTPAGKLVEVMKPFQPGYSRYYLDGEEYSERKFLAIRLEKELSSVNQTQIKRTKV